MLDFSDILSDIESESHRYDDVKTDDTSVVEDVEVAHKLLSTSSGRLSAHRSRKTHLTLVPVLIDCANPEKVVVLRHRFHHKARHISNIL